MALTRVLNSNLSPEVISRIETIVSTNSFDSADITSIISANVPTSLSVAARSGVINISIANGQISVIARAGTVAVGVS